MNNGIHRKTGGTFKRLKPTLCPGCKHFKPEGYRAGKHDVWDVCGATGHLLSNPTSAKKHRCGEYESASTAP